MIKLTVSYSNENGGPIEKMDREIAMFARRDPVRKSWTTPHGRIQLEFKFDTDELDFALLAHDELMVHIDPSLRPSVTVDVNYGT